MTPPIISQETKETNFQAIAPQKSEPVMLRTKSSKGGPWGALFFVLFVASAAAAGWLYMQNQSAQASLTKVQNQLADMKKNSDVSSLTPVQKLNKHMILPQAQSAQVTPISNAADLKKNDTFYEYAENGDLLVQFPNLEIIYNSQADVIVNARTKNSGLVAGAEARALQGAVTLEIRNGAGVAGLAGKTADTFKGVKEYVIKTVGNAARGDYSKTVIVNLAGKDVSGLEKQFSTQAVTVLPKGEKTSDADVVVIVGRQ